MIQIDFYRVEILNFRFLTLIIHFTLFLHYGMDKGFSYVKLNIRGEGRCIWMQNVTSFLIPKFCWHKVYAMELNYFEDIYDF